MRNNGRKKRLTMRGSWTVNLVVATLVLTVTAENCRSIPASVVSKECPTFDPTHTWIKFADHRDCGKYYKCIGGQLFPDNCPVGLHFHQSLGHCVEPKIAGCNYTFTVPIYNNCTEYYEIKNGDKFLKTCEKGLYYSRVRKTCTTPLKSGCKQPPGPCNGRTDGEIIAHENSCSKYWVCRSGQSVPKECPSGEYLNIRKQCGAPGFVFSEDAEPLSDSAGCSQYSRQPFTKLWCNEPSQCGNVIVHNRACLSNTKMTFDDNDCGKYYVCRKNELVSMNCPRGLHFHKCLELCVKPEIAGCKYTYMVPSDRNCNKYYTIRNYVKIEKTCPRGLYFSPTSKTCTTPLKSGCEQMSGQCHGSVNGRLVAHKSNCREFWKCRDGKPIPMTCFTGLYLNIASRGCVKPEKATCDLPILVPDDKGCSRYREIIRGTVKVKNCPPGLEFSPTNENCTDPRESGCEQTFGLCNGRVNGDLVAHKSSCSKFWVCSNGKPIPNECPPELYLNIHLRKCVRPEEATCDFPILEPSWTCFTYWKFFRGQMVIMSCPKELEFSPTKKICVEPRASGCQQPQGGCKANSRLAHNSQCRRYWECRAGSWTFGKCPDGLYFSKVTSECVERKKVTCPELDYENSEFITLSL